MRISFAALAFALALPSGALAADGGIDDAGADDAGALDAGVVDAGAVPDASAVDDTGEHCLDGYDRGYVDACTGKAAGAACTFPGGEPGQCATLRCLGADGRPLLLCVAEQGVPAPPPTLLDAGLAPADGGSGADVAPGPGGGGCALAADPSGAASFAALLMLLRRRGRRSLPQPG